MRNKSRGKESTESSERESPDESTQARGKKRVTRSKSETKSSNTKMQKKRTASEDTDSEPQTPLKKNKRLATATSSSAKSGKKRGKSSPPTKKVTFHTQDQVIILGAIQVLESRSRNLLDMSAVRKQAVRGKMIPSDERAKGSSEES